MKKIIPSDFAKIQIDRIDQTLKNPHVLIGGLAVQQYHKTRNSKDIDLICDNETAKSLIDQLYPTKDYNIIDKNNDEYRPSFEISHRIDKSKIIFFGPKIIERDPYNFLDLESLLKDSVAFNYSGKTFENVRVPRIETLAYTKLLSFLNRISINKWKGEMDLLDFINLTNQDYFRFNILIDHIRASQSEIYIKVRLTEITDYNKALWNSSLFMDFLSIMSPVLNIIETKDLEKTFDNNYDKLFNVSMSVDFYNLIASNYDERNTQYILSTHKKIITTITEFVKGKSKCKILDLGGGTGRLIALHFFDNENIDWHCLDPSEDMLSQFELNLRHSKIKYKLHKNSIFSLPFEITNEKFDVILISCVLTSLPNNPNFASLISLLNIDGTIIIADIHPCMTQKEPYYDFKINNSKIALTPRMIDPLEIINELMQCDMAISTVHLIENRKKEKYSFVLQFNSKSS